MGKRAGKGAAWEREFSKRVSLWWTHGHYDDWFWRSQQSGGRATSRRHLGQSTFKQSGDIAAVHPEGIELLNAVSFELKCGYNKAHVADTFDKLDHYADQPWEKFWSQAVRDAEANGSYACLLITKRDRRKPMVWQPGYLSMALRKLGVAMPQIQFRVDGLAVHGLPLDDWFDSIQPDDIRELMTVVRESERW